MTYYWVESHPECSVCLQQCLQPVQLPCKHIFCFLCLKGFAYRSKKCALCRSNIELEYFNNPVIIKVRGRDEVGYSKISSNKTNNISSLSASIDTFYWFYEGLNGWWQYDERATSTLEKAFSSNKKNCELRISGFLYVIDFERMVQYRKDNSTRLRKIKRDCGNVDLKGIAGLMLVPKDLEREIETKSDSNNSINKNEQNNSNNASITELVNFQESSTNEVYTLNLASSPSLTTNGVDDVSYGIQQITFNE